MIPCIGRTKVTHTVAHRIATESQHGGATPLAAACGAPCHARASYPKPALRRSRDLPAAQVNPIRQRGWASPHSIRSEQRTAESDIGETRAVPASPCSAWDSWVAFPRRGARSLRASQAGRWWRRIGLTTWERWASWAPHRQKGAGSRRDACKRHRYEPLDHRTPLPRRRTACTGSLAVRRDRTLRASRVRGS